LNPWIQASTSNAEVRSMLRLGQPLEGTINGGVHSHGGTSMAGWFIEKCLFHGRSETNMDDLEVPPILGNLHWRVLYNGVRECTYTVGSRMILGFMDELTD
jgi:hypothetical protein